MPQHSPSQTSDSFPAAVLWDMDGTLVDTEPYWIATEFALVERWGGTWSKEQALQLVGRDLLDSGAYIRDHADIDRTPQQIVDELLDGVVARVRESIPWRPGARELLIHLREQAVPCALVTMSWTRFVEPILEQLPEGTFNVVITGDKVSRGKPHPEPYLAAAAALAVDPAACVAIEDSDPGASSAVGAGCVTLVVENHVPVPQGPGRLFRPTLVGLTLDDLTELTS